MLEAVVVKPVQHLVRPVQHLVRPGVLPEVRATRFPKFSITIPRLLFSLA
jgi:hypothetical protein